MELPLIRGSYLAVDEAGGFPHSRARDQDDVDLGSVGEVLRAEGESRAVRRSDMDKMDPY